jgi:nucleoside-diphosphate-sugar epimerase
MWHNTKVLVTGGASFIGSTLVDTLLQRGSIITVADDLSSGRLTNLEYSLKKQTDGSMKADNLTFWKGDLKNRTFARKVVRNNEVVFHLAATHGGRGFIHTHPADCCTNMLLDEMVFEESYKENVGKLCFASSACVYPQYLQDEMGSNYLLKESDADPFIRDKALADLEYGWAKFMGEMALNAYHRQYKMKTVSVRIFTAYGPRENETHAIIALIAKAFIHMDPYDVWGSGEQDRNFTYVQDIVNGLISAAEHIEDGSVVNAGRDDRITINQAAQYVFELFGWQPKKIKHDLTMPQGVASRAADLTLSRKLLKYEPQVGYKEGFKKTIEWYVKHKNPEQVKANLTRLLMER